MFNYSLFADIFDKDASGTISLNEFQQLFNYINQWKSVFAGFDKDRSGKIDQSELNQGIYFRGNLSQQGSLL